MHFDILTGNARTEQQHLILAELESDKDMTNIDYACHDGGKFVRVLLPDSVDAEKVVNMFLDRSSNAHTFSAQGHSISLQLDFPRLTSDQLRKDLQLLNFILESATVTTFEIHDRPDHISHAKGAYDKDNPNPLWSESP